METEVKHYRKVTAEELEKVKELLGEARSTQEREVSITNRGFRVSQMYEGVQVSLDLLIKLSELFGTRDIDTDQWHTDGCETCDFGSNYEVEFLIGGEEC